MKQERMTITKQRMLAPRIYEMTLSGALVQEMPTPGQFLHIRVPDDDFLLRRPISISWIDQESQSCRIIYRTEGEGTKRFAHLQSGDQLDVLGPLGNGFHIEDLQKDETVFIVGGGIGVPPLYELSKQLVAKGVRTIHFLGFASSEVMYYEKAFQALGDTRIATDDGTYGVQGNVGNLLLAADSKPAAVFACGNNGLLKTVPRLSECATFIGISHGLRDRCLLCLCLS